MYICPEIWQGFNCGRLSDLSLTVPPYSDCMHACIQLYRNQWPCMHAFAILHSITIIIIIVTSVICNAVDIQYIMLYSVMIKHISS